MEKLRNADGLTEEEFLAQYKPSDYERPSVTVDMVVLAMSKSLDRLKILLIKRKNHPYIGQWALPGGFMNPNESGHQAAQRELFEETGIKNVYLEQFYIMTQPNRDPRMWVMSIDYLALIRECDIVAGDDASEALWFDISLYDNRMILYNDEHNIRMEYKLKKKVFKNGVVKTVGYIPVLDNSDVIKNGIPVPNETALAFDHAESILEGMLLIRDKIEHSDIAFSLVPKEFTMPDLQSVYESILGRELYKTNFKSKLVGKIEQLDKKGVSITGGKRSTLYRYRGDIL
jgi:ADP-ribose pyrophosphatase YjhB (NUDIX family)